MDDDWNPDLRFSAMKMMGLVVDYLREHLSDFQISKLYPMILERLDDAQDPIRIQTCEVIKRLFLCTNVRKAFSLLIRKLGMGEGTIQYIVKTCFIHLDDRKEEIQQAIFGFLMFASQSHKHIVVEEARKALPKQKFPQLCDQILKLLTQDSGNEGIIAE